MTAQRSETQAGDGTIGKAVAVLDLVAGFERPVRFNELRERSPFPKATLYRLLQTLTNQGLLALDPERQTYAPGLRLMRLAHAAWEQSSLAPVARPHLARLAARACETVHLAQLDAGQVLYVDKRVPSRPVEMFSQAGKVGPAHCTGVGKAMLAFLEGEALDRAVALQSFYRFTPHTITDAESLRAELAEIRDRGHAFDREEHEPGIICVAMPILSARGRVIGALSVTSVTARKTLDDLEKMVPLLRETAACISKDTEAWRFPDPGRARDKGESDV
ncbi:IclR family transcriptional regulator [Limimaricola cinnabarinus]|jgi:DNA-binding IclR family transcriptional regulator|uniref:IclR family transcriptional regulator n=1 Tax=Limimaricola cinnabarinus TaxID=1125964 RepID=A0A2G1MCE2_9RHOB|nr:IclR family transcriptional regulator [Limimaricola cinnabarinus]PHP26397.1 IclR family transcriptional regulator [Limimaricola cinnabarinus]